MVDRHDIDALLISALYGELAPADEARLAAHLESHPADRTALADMTLARNAIRESRFLTVQLEPPQAVSALLLQEAARRAPKKVQIAERNEHQESWFRRFVVSFVAHPAMAAAAMLVLVVGVAGMLYLHNNAQMAEKTLDTSPAAPAITANSESDRLQQHAGSAYRAELKDEESADKADKYGGQAGAGDAGVALDNDQVEAQAKVTAQKGKDAPEAPGTGSSSNGKDFAYKADKPATKIPSVAKADPKPNTTTYVRPGRQGPQPQPMDIAEEKPPQKTQNKTAIKRGDVDDSKSGMGGGVAPNQDPQADSTVADRRNPSRNTVTPTPPPSAPQSAPDRGADEQKPVPEDLAWARELHKQVQVAVNANDCQKASTLAVQLSMRAPGYYSQNVETDRSLKQCVSYINGAREKQQQSERAQRSRVDAPKAAAKPTKK